MGPEGSSVDVPSGPGEATGELLVWGVSGRGCGSLRRRVGGGGLPHFSIFLGLCVPNFFVWQIFWRS